MSKLLSINVNDHIERKNSLSYLSWAWAWAEVLKIDPKATWKAVEYLDGANMMPVMWLRDGSAMVKVEVTINGETKQSILPVMDHKNKAITNPDAFAINKNIMRCLAKAISMHGLGLYIYAGEDMPEEDPVAASAKAAAFEEEWLPKLRDAAMQGEMALRSAFKAMPASPEKDALWTAHSVQLKAAAKAAEVAA
jgi:hypothetical protein